jgi:group II intron reverse transcriptase/maturase
VQHVGKGIPGLIQHSLRRVSSYCKYVYLSFEKQEIVPSIKGWNTPWFTALRDSGRRSCNRVAAMLSTNSGRNQYAKFTKVSSMKLLGGSVLKNLRLPKGRNSYGNRVFVVTRNFASEGKQLKSSDEKSLAMKSGFDLLKDIADGQLNPSKNVYQIICDPQVLKAGYVKLKSNPASMTPGADEKNLNDLRINEQYFMDLANKLKMERYQPKPTKRVFIPKTGGKTRFLGIPVIEDQIVQHALLYLLEAVFEKTFSDRSHGYRPNRGAHTTCKNIRKWKGVSWFIEGGIVSYFDTINHNKLMEIINQQIKDQQIIDLLWKFLRAGVVIDNQYQGTTIGVPQGGIISPILSNIYLHCFDMYIDKLKKELDTEKTSEPNPEYVSAKSRLRSKKGVDKKRSYKELRNIKSTIRTGLKLYYVRYADDLLLGIWGSKKDAIKIREEVEIFLKEKLDLELSIEKTKITHASKEKVQFLGYDIYSPTPKESFFEKGYVKKRASHVGIYIDAPYNKLKEQLIDENILVEKNGKWLINAVTHWLNYNHAEILYRYNWMINGYLNYYSHVNNLNIFHKLIGFVLRHSCAITLGRKLKLGSRKKVFKKFGKNLEEPTTKLKLLIPVNFESNIKNYKITTKSDPLKILKWTVRTQNLMQGPYVGCGETNNIEIHHVEKLSKTVKAKNPIHRLMSKLGRKQVPICKKCHKNIHSGTYAKNKSPRKAK